MLWEDHEQSTAYSNKETIKDLKLMHSFWVHLIMNYFLLYVLVRWG